jgi:NHLM bacteriocin system ABC transporter ATP-binding protein
VSSATVIATHRVVDSDSSASSVARRSVVLEGGQAWSVTAGYADVFATLSAGPDAPSRRHHLFRATPGVMLFGLPPSAHTVRAVGTEATVLTPTTLEALDRQLQDPETRNAVLRGYRWWVDRLCDYVAAGMPPTGCMGQTPGQDVTLDEDACVRPSAGIVVVEVLSGSAELCGRNVPLVEGDSIVLSWRAWLRMKEAGSLRFTSLQKVAERGDMLRALASFHTAALAGVHERLQEIGDAERKRYASRMSSTVAAGTTAIGTLVATYYNEKPGQFVAPVALSTAHDHLNAACKLVADQLGVPYVKPSATTYRTIKDGIENVARASRFRVRHVSLEPEWWRHEQGPLLAFLRPDHRAVALLPKRRGYVLTDPDGSPPRRVDAATAATIAPTAVTFYRPFRPGPVTLLELVRFSAAGCERELVALLLTGMLTGLMGMGVPIVTGILVNSIIPAADRPQLLHWTVLLLACLVAMAMFNLGRGIALIRLEMKLGYATQAAVWDRLISLPARFFRDYSAGNLATRAQSIDGMRQTLSGATIRGILAGVFSVFNFALLFYYNVWLALAATVFMGITVTIFGAITYLQRKEQRQIVAVNAKQTGVVLQLLTGIRKLRVAGAEIRAFGIWSQLFSEQRRAQLRIATLGYMWSAVMVAFPLLASVMLFTVMLWASDGTPMATGDYLAFMAAFGGCFGAVLTTAGTIIGALSVIPQYEMARPILQALPEISPGQSDPGTLTGDIRVDRVVFGYDPEAPPVLNDLTFHAKAGEFVAFVGPSGSGKSTILRLLLGFETPQSGAVAYDSRDLKELDVRAVRRQIGVVLQGGKLMPGDIHTNVVGCSSATMEEAMKACRMAGFDDDLKQMPMGMHTMVTDGGGTLSGGQRQRLMIARAIVSSPRMLFFDEATSALDNQTQAIVSASLEQLRATRIVIAHRLSTIINADRIHVLEKGRIVQSGTYTELMAQPGPFQELAKRQLA